MKAATEGRVLVLEGVEKAERNVLPVLNNLLENREMQLEDGRFLCAAQRYDKLLKVRTPVADLRELRFIFPETGCLTVFVTAQALPLFFLKECGPPPLKSPRSARKMLYCKLSVGRGIEWGNKGARGHPATTSSRSSICQH